MTDKTFTTPTIKIEQVSREEALKTCKPCAAGLPHLHYYVEAKTKQFENFGECLDHTHERMQAFADHADLQDFHSFNGGKSREDFLSMANVRRSAEKVWNEDNYVLTAKPVSCTTLADSNIDDLVGDENFKGFIKT